MKMLRFLFITGTIIMITMPCTMGQSQDSEPVRKADPNVKWDVRKQYDEHSNLIYYDSSCSRTWKRYGYPEFEEGHLFEHLDSSFFNKPYGFNPFKVFSDSTWMDSFSPDSLFPDAYMPFDDAHEFFERHLERMERFREEFTFPDDSIHHFHPEWQQLPRQQKKPARVIEI